MISAPSSCSHEELLEFLEKITHMKWEVREGFQLVSSLLPSLDAWGLANSLGTTFNFKSDQIPVFQSRFQKTHYRVGMTLNVAEQIKKAIEEKIEEKRRGLGFNG